MLASEIPILVFLIQYFGFISIDTAFFLAKVLGLITIFSFSIIIERAMKKPWLQTIIYSLISSGIGVLIIGLKILTK
jgi:predicted small integral membrane protein